MASSLDSLIKEASDFISSEFNLQIKKSQLKIYSPKNWKKFYEANKESIIGFQKNDEGLYIPKSYSAYLREDSAFFVPNVFHEFFGHGLFCEQSSIGKKLVKLTQNKGDANSFLYDKIDLRIQPLGLTNKNIDNYEGFALWLEALLCKETGNKKNWDLKKEAIHKDYRVLFEYFQEAEKKLTRFGFMSQLGFLKEYDGKKIVNTLKHLYGSNFNNIEFVVLYGSQKPESDIDLFIVSNNPSQNYFNGWLDIYELNKKYFQYLADKLDIRVTDPLFSGNLIYGDKSNFEKIKKEIQAQPISQEAINHNLKQAQKQQEYLPQFKESPRDKKNCLRYIKTYKINAQELSKGKKILTLKNIKEKKLL